MAVSPSQGDVTLALSAYMRDVSPAVSPSQGDLFLTVVYVTVLYVTVFVFRT